MGRRLLGVSVSVSNELAVAGAPGDDGAGMNSGTAYVYRLDGSKWALEAALTASDAVAGDAVAVSDDVVVIGASQHEPTGFRSGSAYVFRFDGAGWIEEAKLTASDAAAYDQFGRSVAVSGDVIVIGAFSNDDAGTNSGSAYVFRFDGTSWPQEAKLTASNAAQGDEFGTAVAVDGDAAVISAVGDNHAGFSTGSAYIFRFDGTRWTEEAHLTASDAAADDRFGTSVSIRDGAILIGAPGDNGACQGEPYGDCGSAYVYRFDGIGWIQEVELTASAAAPLAFFGRSVSLTADTALIGAPGDNDGAVFAGAAYLFRLDLGQWIEQVRLTAPDAGPFDQLGSSVSTRGDVAAVGARFDDHAGLAWAGSVQVFVCARAPVGDLDGDGAVGITDLLALLSAWGPCPDPPETCPADLDGDSAVGITDFLILLANWG